ncbi:MAG: hypothetical protein Q8R82_08000 [Hyphomonadaceae bacterium]|nr:hypothetical protein [Hyphomonadaceae bacterium]
MLLAFLRAYLEHCSDEFLIAAASPSADCSCCSADIGAVEVEPDALDQRLNVVFLGEAGIGADRTDLRTIQAFLDTLNQAVVRAAFDVGMRADHFAYVHQGLLNHRVRSLNRLNH